MIREALYSINGLAIGYLSSRLMYERKVVHMWKRRKPDDGGYDPDAPIPDVGVNQQGHPILIREEVRKESPIPRSITIIVIILMAMSVAYIVWAKTEEAAHARRANDRLAAQVEANRALIGQLKHQQGIIDANEQRLEDLILAVSSADTPEQVDAAIQQFLRSSRKAHQQEQRYQNRNGGSAQDSSSPDGDAAGSSGPGSEPSSHPQASPQHSSSPSPRPSHSPSPKPSPSPSKTPLAEVCIATPQGRVCVPVALVGYQPFYFIR